MARNNGKNDDSKTKPNGRGRQSRKPKKFEKPEVAGNGYEKTRGSNDFAWHTPDANLLERASDLSWSFQTGEIMNAGQPLVGDTFGITQSNKASQAGILVIRDQLSCGGIGMYNPAAWEQNFRLPSYNAANTLLTEMRAKARIRNTYDAPDVFMLMMAMANIYAGVTLAKRLAATVRGFTYKNEYFPEALIQAQGFDPQWFKVNQYRFCTELNVIISEINKIYIPDRMHLFQLINERFSNYYTEGENVRDQVYMFTPAFLNAIDFNPSTDYASHVAPIMVIPGVQTGGSFTTGTKYSANALYTGDKLLDALRFMINKVIEHDSTPDITGDMENCFGPSERFYLSECMPDAIVVPVCDEEILETIHNMSWSNAVRSAFVSFDTTSSPYWTAHGPFTTFQNPGDNRIGSWDYFPLANDAASQCVCNSESCVQAWLDVHKDPNPQKTFAITRLKNISGARTVYNSVLYNHMIFSTDLVCDVEMYYFSESGGVPVLQHGPVIQLVPATGGDLAFDAKLQAFHYRPMRAVVDSASYLLVNDTWPLGETDIWARCSYDLIINTNRISLLSLLGAYDNLK